HPVSPGHHPCSGLNAGATNGHQRSTLLPAKPAAPSNLPHLPAEGSAGAGKDYGKPQVNKKKFGRRKRTRQ
ncbi:hypothetical protein, partial [Rhizobium ruizarguesonis]|uniref:hypothetical protein n=1 Tax=Rhizobium ruizarguesonis TaxID=2081791 RepID=UPI001A8CD12B